jgi:hypothetical protein
MIRQAGVLEVVESGLRLPLYDYVSNATTSTSDTYTFRRGGASGTILCVVAIVYTDTTKGTISTVTRTPAL